MTHDQSTVRAQRGPAAEDARGPAPPGIDYLAKDYASFRRLLLDRLAQLIPAWQERHIPDIGILLVELMAYVGDHLSYYQDAVATEAYLGTARHRTSIRRHARLVDYPMHEGCNARAWVCVKVQEVVKGRPVAINPNKISLITSAPGLPPASKVIDQATLERSALRGDYELFEPIKLQRPDVFVEADILDVAGLEALLDGANPYLQKLVHHKPPPGGPATLLMNQLPRALQLRRLPDSHPSLTPKERSAIANVKAGLLSRLRAPTSDDAGDWASIVAALNRLLFEPDLARLLDPTADPDPPLSRAALVRRNRALLDEAFDPCLRRFDRLYFYQAHNEMRLYGGPDGVQRSTSDLKVDPTRLSKGATVAWLIDGDASLLPDAAPALLALPELPGTTPRPKGEDDPLRHLMAGDVLIFEATGAQPDIAMRHAVRLWAVEPELADDGTKVVKISWGSDDALPWDLPLLDANGSHCAVARGNVMLVDHGRTIEHQPHSLREIRCGERTLIRLRLREGPLTYAERIYPFDSSPASAPPTTSARALIRQDPRRAMPEIKLYRPVPAYARLPEMRAAGDAAVPKAPQLDDLQRWQEWRPRPDLLDSGPRDPHFVVEIDDDEVAHLRFGDGELGAEITPSAECRVTYRVGNGGAGNVGAEALTVLVYRGERPAGIQEVRNPLRAQGGTPPEQTAEVKLFAPDHFRTRLQRAITADDYAESVMRAFACRVQRASATLRWNGTRYDVFIAVDPLAPVSGVPALCQEIERALAPFRRMGHGIVVREAEYVPIDLALKLYLADRALRGQVRAQVGALLADREHGLFAPNRLSFGQELALSQIVAAAHVPGVVSVEPVRFQRFERLPQGEIDCGALALGPFEIAELDPARPRRGRLELDLVGGR